MKILTAEVDWMMDYANDPKLIVHVDELPSFPHELPIWTKQANNMVWAEKDGFVEFVSYGERQSSSARFLGFGGRDMKRMLSDGTILDSNNWWSGNSRGVTDIRCMEITVLVKGERVGYAMAMLVDKAQEVLMEFIPNVYLVQNKLGFFHPSISMTTNIKPERLGVEEDE